MVITVIVAVIAAGCAGVYALGQSWIGDLDDFDVSDAGQLNSSLPSVVYASDGTTVLARQVEYRDPVELDEISDYVKQGTVATEDERFYEHGGFDLAGIARAVYVNLTGSGKEGASTITQQYVRNTILADEMTDISFKRKVREMYLSVKMEEQYSKDEILLMYLNTINYGSGAYGIEAAAQRYFSKSASELTPPRSSASRSRRRTTTPSTTTARTASRAATSCSTACCRTASSPRRSTMRRRRPRSRPIRPKPRLTAWSSTRTSPAT